MFKLTKQLRRFAVRKWGLADDVTDAKLRAVIGKKLLGGLFTAGDIEDINAGREPGKKSSSGSGKKADPAPKKKAPAGKKSTNPNRDADDDEDDDDRPAPRKKSGSAARINRLIEDAVEKKLKAHGVTPSGGSVDPVSAFTKTTKIRVKEAAEQFDDTKKTATYPMVRKSGDQMVAHPFAGQPAKCGEVNLNHPSDLDKAVAAAWMKFQINRSPLVRSDAPRWCRMTDTDKELILYAAHNQKWVGQIATDDGGHAWVKRKKLNEWQIKTLLDDSASGGIEITPVVFDDALILTPVLKGELFPFVRVENVARGRRVKGGRLSLVDFQSGIGEGTAITPFNTANFVSAFDTPIYPAVAAIELGQDFEEDSPVDLGGQIVEQFGLKALEWLDRVIAIGTGYNEPLGVFNATATTLVNSTFGAGGPVAVSDFEALQFALEKQYRTEPDGFNCFISNDYTYKKARAVNVGPGDQRRVFGMDHQAYTLLDSPYKVQNGITDGWAAYCNLRRYRMYRRLGMQVRVETGGRQLALSNTRLIVVRMRYGGQPDIAGAFAVCKDMMAA